MMLNRRQILLSSAASLFLPVLAGQAHAGDWPAIEAAAKGQTVYFNAWAGSEPINAYIAWAAGEMRSRYGVTVEHVKITDAAEVVKRVRDEVAAGKQDGSVDLIWINGENFRAMKSDKLLFGPFSEALPNYQYVDTEGKPTTRQDFAETVDGLESPWGMAQLSFFADGAKVPEPPRSIAALTRFAAANPGRVTYPAPPDFHGTTFIKQVLIESAISPKAFAGAADPMLFSSYQPVWESMLDALHASMWREGKQFPKSQAEVTQMVADGEVLIGLTFNPNEPANLVAAGTLPASTIAWQNEKGTIGNTHFVAIPVNAKAKEAAQVFANFLLSPEAQARKNDIKVWGDPTVLAVAKLPADQQAAFAGETVAGSVSLPGPTLLEPHASWVPLLEAAWLKRYGKG
jgi:putative thiamine transport system substrate-binding protein